MLINRGEILQKVLRNWCDNNGATLSYVAKKAGYNRSTLYRHFNEALLEYGIIRKYGNAIRHDFSKEFPEIKEMGSFLIEPEPAYAAMSSEECLTQIEFWRNKYIVLLEQYNTVVVNKLLLNSQ